MRHTETNGAGDRIRTGDINLGKVALYQLSYSREVNYQAADVIIVARRKRDCQTKRAIIPEA